MHPISRGFSLGLGILILLTSLGPGLCIRTADRHPQSNDPIWKPQQGTVEHPKTPEFNLKATRGEVFQVDGRHFRARNSFYLHRTPLESIPEKGAPNLFWQSLIRGSFAWPKILGQNTRATAGDIFKDPERKQYYRCLDSTAVSRDPDTWQTAILNENVWETVDVKSTWLTLLGTAISDKRLSELVMPGSHESGSFGIDGDSVLVDPSFLFGAARISPKDAMVEWAVAQHYDLETQLQLGFRALDLRVADLGTSFHWYHGYSGHEIQEGLNQIANFADDHPRELILLNFRDFQAVGTESHPNPAITDHRKNELSGMILVTLGSRLIRKGGLSANPTIQDLLNIGGNIMATVTDEYIQKKDDRFWSNNHYRFDSPLAASNPEDLFQLGSILLQEHRGFRSDSPTYFSCAVTPSQRTLAASLILTYGPNESRITQPIQTLLDVQPREIHPDAMSFEGLFTDLMTMATEGTNTAGMAARSGGYSRGGSAHYKGVNAMVRHWLDRPQLYKVNVVYADSVNSSLLVDIAIDANQGVISREITIAHQGSPLDGALSWQGQQAIDGATDDSCRRSVVARVTILYGDTAPETHNLTARESITIAEGQYPPETSLHLDYALHGSAWKRGFEGNIQTMIEYNLDQYIRGTDFGFGRGFAYVSTRYDDFGERCDTPPSIERVVTWETAAPSVSSAVRSTPWLLLVTVWSLTVMLGVACAF